MLECIFCSTTDIVFIVFEANAAEVIPSDVRARVVWVLRKLFETQRRLGLAVRDEQAVVALAEGAQRGEQPHRLEQVGLPLRIRADVPNGADPHHIRQGGNPQARVAALNTLDAFLGRVLTSKGQ